MGGGPVNTRYRRYQVQPQNTNNNAPPDMSQSSLYPNYQYVPVSPQQFDYYRYYNTTQRFTLPAQPFSPSPLPPPLPPLPPAYARSRMTFDNPAPPPPQATVNPSTNSQPVRFIYAKSGFHVRPNTNTNSNGSIHGFFMIVSKGESTELNVCVAWVPEYLVSTEDLALLIQLDGALASEKGFPGVKIGPGEQESMMIPLTGIHSLYVRPPDTSNEGTIIITTTHGDILRPLFYQVALNDDGTPSTPWPGYDIVDILDAFATVQRLAEDEHVYLLAQQDDTTPATTGTIQTPPSIASSPVTGASITSSPPSTKYPLAPHENDPIRQAIQDARWDILERLSRITKFSRNTAAQVLDHPLARPIVPLLPPSVQAMSRNRTVMQTMNEYDRATYYLARWGGRHEEQDNENRFDDPDGLLSNMPEMQMSPPTHTRRHAVSAEEWVDLFDDLGRLRVTEHYVHGLIFRGGLDPDVRIEAWKFLLGIYPWDSTFDEREAIRRSKIDEYYEFKAKWFNNMEVRSTKEFQDEKHRIDKDVHRTDRSIEFFEGETLPNPDPDMTVGTNPNLEIMKDILVTYNFYNTELGYVQGMSDLLAPLFVAMGTEEMAFWGFVKFMDRVQSNFFKDQSGMHGQLQTLDALIRFMDPTLYKRLEETETVNLFFCFRWLLVWFKREFEWEDVIRLWEVLWTDYLSPQMIMFVALAVIDKHRQVILNDLHQFDEVLKYINELSGNINLQETLERAEVLFYQFERRVKAMDKKKMQLQEQLELRSVWNSNERPQIEVSIEKLSVDGKLRALLKQP